MKTTQCKITVICNQKGGVTKTTTTANLGIGLAMEGRKVLLVDIDPQADLTTSLGWKDTDSLPITLATIMEKVMNDVDVNPKSVILNHNEGVDLIPASLELSGVDVSLVNAMSREFALRSCLEPLKQDYDHIIKDCPPSLSMLTLNALVASDSVIIPVQAQYLPAKGMTQLMKTIAKVRKQVNPHLKVEGIVLTLADMRTNLARLTAETLKDQYGSMLRIFKTQIPIAVKAAETSIAGQSIFVYDKGCHISISIMSRSKGKSAVAAAAYRAGEKITCEYNGKIYDYTRKGGIVYKEIILPEHAPIEYKDRTVLWNSVEMFERYKTAQLAREFVIALPVELTREQNITLAREYVQKNFANAGMCVDLCVHDNGDGNPHAHIMCTMRAINQNGAWAQKSQNVNGKKVPVVDWNEQSKAEDWRKAWADLQNEYLRKLGFDISVDHRSFAREGIDRIPTIHLGTTSHQMEKRGIRTVRGDINRNIEMTNSKLKQLNARIRKAKDELYALPLPDSLSMVEVAKNIAAWRNFDNQWKKIQNLKSFANMINFLSENSRKDMSDVVGKAESMYDESRTLKTEVNKIDRRLDTLSLHLYHVDIWEKHKMIARKFNKLTPKEQDKHYKKHKPEIDAYRTSIDYLKRHLNGKSTIPINSWKAELKELTAKRYTLCEKYYGLHNEIKSIEQLRRSADVLTKDIELIKSLRKSRELEL